MSTERGGKWFREDIEVVYQGSVLDSTGTVKENPNHVVVPQIINMHMSERECESSGKNISFLPYLLTLANASRLPIHVLAALHCARPGG